MLQSSTPYIPERILLMGAPNSGKTSAALQLARVLQATGSPSQVHIIDTDGAIPRMLTAYGELTNIHLHTCHEWPEMKKAILDISHSADNQDWIVVDFLSSLWDAVQNWYVSQVWNQSIDDYMIQKRKSLTPNTKNFKVMDGWLDWPVIKQIYAPVIEAVTVKQRCHVLATATMKALSEDDTGPNRELFGQFGVRPAGDKDIAHRFHTVLIAAHKPTKGWTLTTVKDRERTSLSGQPVNSFPMDYLVTQGWTL